jgi:hypothetical protein
MRTRLASLTGEPSRKETTHMASATQNVQDVKQTATQQLAQQKDGAADTLGSFAGALRKAAHESDGSGGGAAHMADWAAEGLERVSATLRSNDLNGMMRQVESFARSQPVAFFFAAAAAGFLATRFVKAGASQPDGDSRMPEFQRDAGSYEPGPGAIDGTDISSTLPR